MSQTDDSPGSKVSNAPLHMFLSSKGDYDDELKLRITNAGARMTQSEFSGTIRQPILLEGNIFTGE